MNIFWLDSNVSQCAQYHCDKHVVKMITEYTQLLSSAYYYSDNSEYAPYKLSHRNHPCALWARYSLDNWKLLLTLACALYIEYKYRYYGRVHRAGENLIYMATQPPLLPKYKVTKPPLCMPDDCKQSDVIQAYRSYYNNYKQHLFHWTDRPVPFWISE